MMRGDGPVAPGRCWGPASTVGNVVRRQRARLDAGQIQPGDCRSHECGRGHLQLVAHHAQKLGRQPLSPPRRPSCPAS